MTKKTVSSIFAILAICVLGSCTKEPSAKATSTHYVSASSSSIGSFYVSDPNISVVGAAGLKITITATASSGATIDLYVNPYAATPGIIVVDTNTGGVYTSASSTTAVGSVPGSGSITLTSVTPDIIGSFSYIGSDGNTFTGSFNVPAP